ncbi:MAG TPA: aminotransferase class I/II-fold pyridoxal phosphate-dependent enzyme [Thermomicrobiales bacterium]|nr:aminotransferase class I/II-fold pyridoxal phosphate-dependent enzyme [Thermomicrobiales bacterium]
MTSGATAATGLGADRAEGVVDQQRAPLLEGIRRYHALGIVPFSTPGHKLGGALDDELRDRFGETLFRNDIPLGGGIDDTHFQGETLQAAEWLAAAAWNADRTFYLVNGSSAGNHAYLLAAIRPGDTVIVGRDMHKSVLVALILTGAKPVYVAPRLHPALNVGMGVAPDDIAAALDAHPEARLVALVSPSYCGVSSDLAGIAAVAHARGVPVYVDEAWGPHFHFHPALPPSAMASGVDGAVTSAHKMLGSLTQAALLNTRGPRVEAAKIKTAVGMVVTTSPSVPLLASIDGARRQMALQGEALLERAIALAADARRRLRAIPGVGVLDGEQLGAPGFDLTKLVIDVNGLGVTGFAVEALLRERFGIGPEMSDLVGVVCLVTLADNAASIDRLVQAFATIAAERAGTSPIGAALRSSGAAIAPGEQAMSPREAFFADVRTVPLAEAVGEVSAELVIPYPPGIPVLAPGDIVSAEKIAYLEAGAASGMYFSGPVDQTLATIRVVDHVGRLS